MLWSCKSTLHRPVKKSGARLGEETPLYSKLTSLPSPTDPIIAAVYKFRDHTGQYKPAENGASWSTAVTQGATSILIRAMEESKWFVPIERENLSNILNERKIIRSSRAQYQQSPEALPPLLFAGIVLEGGIISYQTNTVTGGAGLRYFGAGGSEQYREDKVTVYLRAVSTSNGKILKTVYTSKTILSQTVDIGLFRFVKFEKLLEVETGFTYNEPSDMAVTEAIEKAVMALIIDGAQEGLWQFKDSTAWKSPVVNDYLKEKEEKVNVDEFGKYVDKDRRGKFGIGAGTGAWLYAGDYPNAMLKPYIEGSLMFNFSPSFGLNINVGQGTLAVEEGFENTFYNYEVLGNWRFTPDYKFSPYLQFGVSALSSSTYFYEYEPDKLNYHAVLGLGFEHNLSRNLDFNFSLSNSYSFSDDFDGEVQGVYNDFYWAAKVGLRLYLFNGKKKKHAKLTPAPQESAVNVLPAKNTPAASSIPETPALEKP